MNAGLGEDFERLGVHGRLGQPHSLGIAAKAMPEIGHAPEYLGLLVPGAGEGKDHVIVDLRSALPCPRRRSWLSRSASTIPRRASGAASAIHCKSVGPKLKLIQA